MSVLDSIPDRQQLIARLESANRSAGVWIALQLAGIVCLALVVDWQQVLAYPEIPIVALGLVLAPQLTSILMQMARKKKDIRDLRETTRFGQYDKHLLEQIFADTLHRLKLPDERLPVYIVNDKLLNASAIRLGLAGFFRSLNGIYLNRQILYKLSPPEVQDIMGHELGHYYRHYLTIDRFRIITTVLGTLIGVYAGQLVGFQSYVCALAVAVSIGVCFWISGIPWAKHSKTIEFLCDDLGAQVNGIEHSVNGLMKIGAESEMLMSVQAQVLARRKMGADLSISDIAQAVENSIPYGQATDEGLVKAIEQELRTAEANNGASLRGLFEYLWNGDDDDEEEINELAMTAIRFQKIPRLDWESLLPSDTIEFDIKSIERLVEMIEANPKLSLVRAKTTGGVHPTLKQRVLYLWKNRQAIEDARRGLG